tara:strand:- start:89 stop:556 length:468 start_codon:yes stop_codon:yes gene_type:complete
MITALALAAALTLVPATGGDTWVNHDIAIKKGEKLFDSPISLYQGRHYVEEHNALRYCIRKRETQHAYHRVSDTGKYRGAYQTDAPMTVGMGWMIQKELRETGTPKAQAVWIGKRLRSSKMNHWAPLWQDMGFWLVWNKGKGKSHWEQTARSDRC